MTTMAGTMPTRENSTTMDSLINDAETGVNHTHITMTNVATSTATPATDLVDFNLVCEPLRRALLRDVAPFWDDVRRQLMSISGATLTFAVE